MVPRPWTVKSKGRVEEPSREDEQSSNETLVSVVYLSWILE